MKKHSFIPLIILVFASVALLSLSGCSTQRKIDKAKNRIYDLNLKYQSVSVSDTAIIPVKAISSGKKSKVGFNMVLTDEMVEYMRSLNQPANDTTPLIELVELEPAPGQVGKMFDVIIDCPPQVCETEVQYVYKTIKGECDCQYEVKEKTKGLRRDRVLLFFSTVIGLMLSGIIGFARLKKSK